MNRCVRCRKTENEAAGPECGNPIWHTETDGHYWRACEVDGHCPCYEDGGRCCTCRDRKL